MRFLTGFKNFLVQRNVFLTLLVVSGFTLLAISAPAGLYSTNYLEFLPYTFFDYLPYLLIAYLVSTLILTILLTLFPKNIRRILYLVITAIGFLISFNGIFLRAKFGALNGTAPLWDRFVIASILDMLSWVLLIAVFVIKYKLFAKFQKPLTIVLLSVEITSILLCFSITYEQFYKCASQSCKNNSNNLITAVDDDKLTLGTGKNLLVFVLDAYKTQYFEKVINDKPEYKKYLEGFTYYRNNVSGFRTTDYALPLIMTGEYYNGSVQLQQFTENAYNTRSVSKILYENEFQTYMPIESTIYSTQIISSNYIPVNKVNKDKTYRENLKKSLHDLGFNALYKYSPTFMKLYVWTLDQKGIFREPWDVRDLHLMQEINTIKKSDIQENLNTFKLFHTAGLHPSFNVDENYEIRSMAENYPNMIKKSELNIKYMITIIEKLKELGIYDNTAILFIGDHGNDILEKPTTNIQELYISRATPLFLMKGIESKGDFKVSEAPIATGDIPATILYELKMPYSQYSGKPVQIVAENEARDRFYFDYYNNADLWQNEDNNLISEIKVSGHSLSPDSWEPTGRVFAR